MAGNEYFYVQRRTRTIFRGTIRRLVLVYDVCTLFSRAEFHAVDRSGGGRRADVDLLHRGVCISFGAFQHVCNIATVLHSFGYADGGVCLVARIDAQAVKVDFFGSSEYQLHAADCHCSCLCLDEGFEK
ncbi:hypothetical protein D3C78_977480 [compost metagenome]